VRRGDLVKPGDTLGFVGNTGNARTTPPHLHFGIYMRGIGAVDPYYHLYDPADRPPAFAGDSSLVGQWARIARGGAVARTEPRRSAPVMARVDRSTPIRVLAGVGDWYRARLPDGREGYVAAADAERLDPIVTAAVTAGSVMRAAPSDSAAAMDSLADGDMVPFLGRYGGYALVRRADGLQGWIVAARLAIGMGSIGDVPESTAPSRAAGR